MAEEQAPCPNTDGGRPAFLIDAGAGALLEANSAGCNALGLDPEAAVLPLAMDGAMPAVRRLRELAAGPGDRGPHEERLAFWTARGLVELACRVEPAPAKQGPAVFRIEALETAAPAAPSEREADRGGDLGVGLEAWLAHELRTPLGAVIAYAEVLKNEHFGPLANRRYQTYAANIYDSARHALGVVDSMLRGDRARTPLPSLAFADLDPASVVESCLTVIRPLAEQAGLLLDAELPPHLPRIVADEVSLRQMLLNLLTNAIKYARPGDRVVVAASHDGDGPLVISVSDTGPGIGDTPKAERAGLGLGLPLTRALAAANGAVLGVESAPGRGTRVTITFGKDRVVPV